MTENVTAAGWQVHALGDYHEQLKFQERIQVDYPSGHAVIEVQSAGINYSDILAIAGKYQVKHPLPFTPGSEAVGTIVDPGHSGLKPGQPVLAYCGKGAFATVSAADPNWLFPMPDNIPSTDAAALLITHQTALVALQDRAKLKSGETLLIHSGAGGTGSAAIQIGKKLGARVIATAGSNEKLEICKICGADDVINYKDTNFRDAVLDLTGGRGADVIFESVGGETFEQSTKCIAWEGRILIVGFSSGTIPSMAANRIMLKNIALVGINWPGYGEHNIARLQQAQQTIFEWVDTGDIKPLIHSRHQLQNLPHALDLLGSRESYGKIVLKIE